jgi:hypothetical protein
VLGKEQAVSSAESGSCQYNFNLVITYVPSATASHKNNLAPKVDWLASWVFRQLTGLLQ